MKAASQLRDIPRDRLSVDFFIPAPDLRAYVSGYNVYGAFGPQVGGREFFIPGWTTARFNFTTTPWKMIFGDGPTIDIADAAIFGPSVKEIRCDAIPEGISIGFGITPLGVARLLGVSADTLAGHHVPLAQLWPDADVLHAELAELTDSRQIAPLFDRHLRARLRRPSRDEPVIAALMEMLIDQHRIDVADAARALGCSVARLRRVALKHFGFAPKLLLRRSRFIKSLVAIYGREPGQWSQLIDSSYYDQSHFIRDAQEFLGCSPGDFLRHERPMTLLSMRRRAEILGAPFMSLHRSPSNAIDD